MPIRVLLVDDHAAIREGIRLLITLDPDTEVVGEAADGLDGVRLARELQPDVVLMDLHMPGMDGLAATTAIRESLPATQVIILSSMPRERTSNDALRAGAAAYLRKDIDADDLRKAIWAAVSEQP